MKKLVITGLVWLAVTNSLVKAQSCSGSPFYTPGKQLVFLEERPNMRDPNHGTKQIKVTYAVQLVTHDASGILRSAYSLVKWEDSSDPNAKPPTGVMSGGICDGTNMSYFVHSTVGSASVEDTTVIPLALHVGEQLKDKVTTLNMPRRNGGAMSITILTKTVVEAQESVTTPAGTWNCFKLAVTSTSTMPAMGNFPASNQTQTEDIWVAPGIGLIKSSMSSKFTSTLISIQ